MTKAPHLTVVASNAPSKRRRRNLAGRSGQLSIAPSDAVFDPELSHAGYRVLAAICTYADSETGECWPSQTTIARQLGMKRQSVGRLIQRLITLGYLGCEAQWRGNGSRTSNRYRVLFDDAARAARITLANTSSSTERVQHDVAGPVPQMLHPPATRGLHPERPNKNVPTETHTSLIGAEGAFETFWRTYPSRAQHSNPKKTARQKFAAAVKAGADPADIMRGVEHFAAYVRREGIKPKFIPMAATWLNREQWTDYQRPPETTEEIPWN